MAKTCSTTTAHFAHSMLDLAGIDARGLDLGKSVFAGRLRLESRFFLARGKVREWTGGPGGDAGQGASARKHARSP